MRDVRQGTRTRGSGVGARRARRGAGRRSCIRSVALLAMTSTSAKAAVSAVFASTSATNTVVFVPEGGRFEQNPLRVPDRAGHVCAMPHNDEMGWKFQRFRHHLVKSSRLSLGGFPPEIQRNGGILRLSGCDGLEHVTSLPHRPPRPEGRLIWSPTPAWAKTNMTRTHPQAGAEQAP